MENLKHIALVILIVLVVVVAIAAVVFYYIWPFIFFHDCATLWSTWPLWGKILYVIGCVVGAIIDFVIIKVVTN